MPLYEYRCKKCGEQFERIQKFADAPLQIHEKCGGRVERLLSSAAIQFKGSGFYINDYARKPSPDKGAGPAPDSGSKTNTSETGSKPSTSDSGSKPSAPEVPPSKAPAASKKKD